MTSEQNPPDPRIQVAYVCRRCGGTYTRDASRRLCRVRYLHRAVPPSMVDPRTPAREPGDGHRRRERHRRVWVHTDGTEL